MAINEATQEMTEHHADLERIFRMESAHSGAGTQLGGEGEAWWRRHKQLSG